MNVIHIRVGKLGFEALKRPDVMRLRTESMRGRSSSELRTGVEENRNFINRLNVAGTRKAGKPQAICFALLYHSEVYKRRDGCHGRNRNVKYFSLTAPVSYGRFEGILYLSKRQEPLIQRHSVTSQK
jgi:hypothetical protein